MSRRNPALRLPDPTRDYSDFPSTISRETVVFRAHDAKYAGADVWHFSIWRNPDESGRFDLSAPDGTCYVAESVEVATRERLAGQYLAQGVISHAAASVFAVSTTTLPVGKYAEVTDPVAVDYGVNSELSTTAEYGVTHAWANVFRAALHGGIHYVARFSTSSAPNAYAVFGSSEISCPEVRPDCDGPEACRRVGIEVLSPPLARDVSIDE